MSYIAVIGAGAWGTTLAGLLADKEYDVSLWAYEESVAEEIRTARVNSAYLPGYSLPGNIKVSHKIEEVVQRTRYLLNVIPAQHTRTVFGEALQYINKDAIIINASKGIEKGSLLTISGILKDISSCKTAVLSGPSFADEVIRKLPTAVTIAADDSDTAFLLQEIFNTDYFRVYTHDDVMGVELGGSLKNVMALAAGMSDGLGLGSSTRAALVTRGLTEIMRLGKAMGAKEKTFMGLSGLGDLVLTCTGTLSRNYTVGQRMGQGESLSGILENMTTVAEGVATSEAAYELAKKYSIEMPIVEQVNATISKGKSPSDAVKELMRRTLKAEF